MAKRKIVWTNRAKKRLYGLFDFHIRRTKSKTYPKQLWQLIIKELQMILKHPDIGLKTSKENIIGMVLEDHTLLYQVTGDKIIIHTISYLVKNA
jgi:plasmid stabilization system protein ParE